MDSSLIDTFVDYCQKLVNETYKDSPNTKPTIVVEKGARYIKLILHLYPDTAKAIPDRSVYGFIDTTNGDILKAASWKAPAKNFPRGNVNDPKTWQANWRYAIG